MGSGGEGGGGGKGSWREGSTRVWDRREREVLVPGGGTLLQPGDVITAFGTESSKSRMIERLNAGADEPTAEIELEDIESSESGDTSGEPE